MIKSTAFCFTWRMNENQFELNLNLLQTMKMYESDSHGWFLDGNERVVSVLCAASTYTLSLIIFSASLTVSSCCLGLRLCTPEAVPLRLFGTAVRDFGASPLKYASISAKDLPCVSGRMKSANRKPIIEAAAKNHWTAYTPPRKSLIVLK